MYALVGMQKSLILQLTLEDISRTGIKAKTYARLFLPLPIPVQKNKMKKIENNLLYTFLK